MRVMTLTPAHLGLDAFPSGELRFDAGEHIDNPEDADVILCPPILFNLHRMGIDIRKLPFMGKHSRKHVYWDMSDSRCEPQEFFPGVDSIFLRAALTRRHVEANPRSRAFGWPVSQNGWFDDWERFLILRPENVASLHAFNSCETRKTVAESVKSAFGAQADIILYPDFTGAIWDTPEGRRRRTAYRYSLRNSIVALCPRSIPGNPAYRLYEAMAAARFAVHFCDDAVLPFPKEIDWGRISLQCREADAPNAGAIVAGLLKDYGVDELLKRGVEARRAWETYLDDRYMPKNHRLAVEDILRSEGASFAS